MIDKTYPIIEKLIINALNLVIQLLEQLNQEAEALKKPQEAELINAIAANKKQIVLQLEQFNSHCTQILALEKLPNNQEGIEEYFHRATAAGLLTGESTSRWKQIQSISAQCRALNEQNGAGIELLARYTHRSLQILKGKPQTSNTYGPDGSSQSEAFTRSLISV